MLSVCPSVAHSGQLPLFNLKASGLSGSRARGCGRRRFNANYELQIMSSSSHRTTPLASSLLAHSITSQIQFQIQLANLIIHPTSHHLMEFNIQHKIKFIKRQMLLMWNTIKSGEAIEMFIDFLDIFFWGFI